jgi:hypothetical protein
MLIYTNINGEQEAVSERMIVRFSRKEDLSLNNMKPITFIHLSNGEQLRSLDDIDSLLKQMTKEKNLIKERNNDLEKNEISFSQKAKNKQITKRSRGAGTRNIRKIPI